MGKVFFEPRPSRSLKDEAVARNLERVAWLMDRALTIPGTKISVGLDALLGLFPVGGDVLTGLVQAGLVLIIGSWLLIEYSPSQVGTTIQLTLPAYSMSVLTLE